MSSTPSSLVRAEWPGGAVAWPRAGYSVRVIEAAATVGGGTRSAELTLPGFLHDVCSAVHPMAIATPFFQSLPLAEHGLEWIQPPLPLAHPLDDGTAAVLARSLDETAAGLGPDGRAYRKLMGPLFAGADSLFRELVGPFRFPKHPFLAARFGLRGLRSGVGLAESKFTGEPAKALFAGLAGHSQLPLEKRPSAAVALMLGLAGHAVGWPLPKGGSQRIADALASLLRAHGGNRNGQEVNSSTNCRRRGPCSGRYAK